MEERTQRRSYYTVKRLRLLEHLIKLGFKPTETIPDPNNPKYNWWLFDNTPELESALTEYFKDK